MQTNLILGGGITGLGAGYFLSKAGEHATVVEKADTVGGMAASFHREGFTFDVGPHKLYSTIPGIMPLFSEILGEDCIEVKKKNSLRLCGKYFSFPINPVQFALGFPKLTAFRCGLSYLFAKAEKDIITYEDYFLAGFGKAAYKLLFENFCWKVWGDPKTISAELARRRIPVPSIMALVKNILSRKNKPEVSADTFYYPKRGIGEVCRKLAAIMANGTVVCSAQPSKICLNNNKITEVEITAQGVQERIKNPKNVISTIHLQDVLKLFQPAPPAHVLEAAASLKFRSLIIIHLIVNKPRVLDDHWIFFPEKEFIFNRVSEQKNFSTEVALPDKTFITAEISCDKSDYIWSLSSKELAKLVIQDLEKAGILKSADVIDTYQLKIPRMYPVYDIMYKRNLRTVLDWLHGISNFYTIGRQGLFAYTNTDHSLDMARKLAEQISQNRSRQEWEKTIEYFDSYRIVD